MAAPMSTVFRRLPVVVILGATGTGKSKLAIHIGARFGGEIISADSMQVYKGLDIITNKVTSDEQQSCPHHLIDFLNPLSRCTVVDFRNKALPIIESLLKENRLPVIVGGTNYYIEALLWKVLVEAEHSEKEDLLLHVRGDPVTLRIKKKRRHTEIHPQLTNYQGLSSAHFDSSEICDMSSGIPNEKYVRTCDVSINELSEFKNKSVTTSSVVEGSLTLTGSRVNISLSRGPDLETVSEFGRNEDQRLLNTERKQQERNRKTGKEPADCSVDASTVNCDQQSTGVDSLSSDGNGTEDVPSQTNQPGHSFCQKDSDEFATGSSRSEEGDCQDNEMMTIDVERLETGDLYKILDEVDPSRANTLHPNNRRKIIRSLQVYEQLGRTHSDVLSGQQGEEGGGPLGGPLRFKDVCILWLQCNRDVLDKRLDNRVDDMLKRGLLNELTDFHREYNRRRVESQADSETLYTQGIFQSIGFKEFHPYIILPEGDRESDEAQNLLEEGVKKLKMATRHYARRQNRWVKNRFVSRPGSNVPSVYALDSSDPLVWDEKVLQPALAILGAMVEGKEPPVAPLEPEGLGGSSSSHSEEASSRHVCDICGGRVFVGKQQWLGHLKSKRHYKKNRKLKLASLLKTYEDKMASTGNTQRQDEDKTLDAKDS